MYLHKYPMTGNNLTDHNKNQKLRSSFSDVNVMLFSAAAEGCTLSLYSFDELKNKDKHQPHVEVSVLSAEDDNM